MKNCIVVNEATKTLELNKKFAEAARCYGTEEYRMLQDARRDYPGFAVMEATKKAKAAKNPYKNLTFAFIEKYIQTHDDPDKKKMNEYLDLRGMSEEAISNGAASKSLSEIRDWFLHKYPEIREFHEKREQEMIALKAEKEQKRAEEARKAFEEHIKSLLAA